MSDSLKPFVVYHDMKQQRILRDDGYFETAREALDRFAVLRQTYDRERVYVVDLRSNQVIADSHPKHRRRR